MEHIAENWRFLQGEIAAAAARAGRDPATVEVVAVTKTRTLAEVEAAVGCGFKYLGENRVQEAESKIGALGTAARWHLIGRLQANKAGKAAALFDAVQSVDGLDLAQRLDRCAGLVQRRLEVMIQVNTAGAQQQGGVEPAAVADLVGRVAELPHLQLTGLMTIAAHSADETRVRACFTRLRQLRQAIDPAGSRLPQLSMGMSGDFVWAVEEGATMLRLGTAIFGPRPA